MRTPQAWVVLVVTAAVAAGMLSFLVATPDQSGRVAASELGFARLGTDHVFGAMGHAAAHHRARHSAAVGARVATTTSRSWLAALPGSGSRRSAIPVNVRVAPGRGAAARRVLAFVEWADDLPAPRWRVTTSAPVPMSGVERTWTVAADVQVDVAQAATRTRRQVVPVVLELRGSVAELRGAPRSWVVQDVTVGASPGWLRAYRDPVVVGSEVVDAVAPNAASDLADDAASTATASLARLRATYAPDGGVATLAIWMVERPGQVRAVTRRPAPTELLTAADGAPHGLAWADARGDVVVDLPRFRSAGPAARAGAIRHAVAHVVTGRITTRAPAILAEGIALAEGRRAGGAIVLADGELATLAAAFTSRTSGVADLLVASADDGLDGASDPLVAAATVAWLLEERSATRVRALLESIDAGMAPDTALRRTVGLAPRGVELEVAAWVRAQQPLDDPAPTPAADPVAAG